MTPGSGLLDWLFAQSRGGLPRNPARARELLAQLGAPDRNFRSMLVVGTNGKGSVCTMLEAGLIQQGGPPTGCFTSPHLQVFEERIRVDGQRIQRRRTEQFIRSRMEEPGTFAFFELSLGLACSYFAEQGVGVAVMEAGVGGRGDATAALGEVELVLITNVSLDHTATLGASIREIATEKAGAIRPGKAVLTTARGEGLEVLRAVAASKKAPLYAPGDHPELFRLPHPPRLAGQHQITNAQLALAGLRFLGREEGIEAALGAEHPGRLECQAWRGRTLWLDGAHNPAAAQALAESVGQVDLLIFGIMARKDARQTLAPLLEISKRRIYTWPGTGGLDPELLRTLAAGEVAEGAELALEAAYQLTQPGETILVAGSLHLVGAIKDLLGVDRGAVGR